MSKSDNIEDMTESKQEQLRLFKKKRRKFMHSFYYLDNMQQFAQDELTRSNYAGTTLQYFEGKEKRMVTTAF